MILSSSAVVFAAAFFNTKARSRLVSSVYLFFFILMVLLVGWDYLSALMDETMGQLTDEDYNRVKAFNYFISPVNGEWAFVWGNGFISGHVSSLAFGISSVCCSRFPCFIIRFSDFPIRVLSTSEQWRCRCCFAL